MCVDSQARLFHQLNPVSVIEQLRALHRVFPLATEFAVSPEMAEQFEREIATIRRYATNTPVYIAPPAEAIRGVTLQRLSLVFKHLRLTQVSHA